MLRALLTLLFFVGLGLWAVGWARRRLGSGASRGLSKLDGRERDRLRRLARRSPAMKRALEVRAQVMEILQGRTDPARIRERVDEGVRQLAEQLVLRGRIEQALASSAVEADLPEAPRSEEQSELLARLESRLGALDEGSEHTLRELSNIHLALLELTATEAATDRGALAEALEELETAGFSARGRAEAEQEVSRLLAGKKG
mgnify:CR=1 FL=1